MGEDRLTKGPPCLGVALALFFALAGPAPGVTITEILYNHPAGEDLDFVELHNEKSTPEDISGYRFAYGIRFIFPEGTTFDPGAYLIVARDPRLFAAHYGWAEDDPRLFGPYFGRLDDDGERIVLENDAWELEESKGEWHGEAFYGPDGFNRPGYPGCVLQAVRYGDRDPWPAQADGTGHTLSRISPYRDIEDPANWAPSLRMAGTPGGPDVLEHGYRDAYLVAEAEVWRYFPGLVEPCDPIEAWRKLDFDDSAWLEGRAPFGYGRPVCNTVLERGGWYTSVYIRKVFEVGEPEKIDALVLQVVYDDGFVAYLNGVEVARVNLKGDPVTFDARASPGHGAQAEEFDISRFKGFLLPGPNILAVQCHNVGPGSVDFVIDPRLMRRSIIPEWRTIGTVVLNEIAVADLGGLEKETFVEFYNCAADPFDLSGSWLSERGSRLKLWQIPDGTVVPAKGFLAIREREFPEARGFLEGLRDLYVLRDNEVSVFLTAPEGDRVVDAATVSLYTPSAGARPPGFEATHAYGRFPDGTGRWAEVSERTPGAPNRVDTVTDLVINEIMYHPFHEEDPYSPLDEKTNPPGTDREYIELYNRGSEPIPLDGIHFIDGIEYAFPPGSVIDPGQYLVLAKNPARIEAIYGIGGVYGPYRKVLGDAGERIAVADARGNIIDEVRYYDAEPWPEWADGLGSSLELVDPRNDNTVAAAWAASDESGRSRWTQISYRGTPAVDGQEFQVLLPGRGEILIDEIAMVHGGTNEIPNGTFDSDTDTWVFEGTHWQSYRTIDPEQGPCLKIVSTGRGNTNNNRIECDTRSWLTPGKTYEIRYRARWLRGISWLLTRTYRNGAAYAARIPVPEILGTPGEPNSVSRANQGPVMDKLRQSPILPGSEVGVVITVGASDADGVAAVRLHHRDDETTEWETAPMFDDGLHGDGEADDGVFGGTIPPHDAARRVHFYVEAEDALGAVGVFPIVAPEKAALYRVGLQAYPRFALQTFRVILSEATHEYLYHRPLMSNDLVYGSFILGNDRIIYNTGFRLRGWAGIRQGERARGLRIRFPADEPLYGLWREIDLEADRFRDLTLQRNWAYSFILRTLCRHTPHTRVPYPSIEWVNLEYRGTTRRVYEHVQKVGGEFVQSWWRDDDDGALHEVDEWIEERDGLLKVQASADMTYRGEDKEAYRWLFPLRTNEKRDDYGPLIRLCSFMDTGRTPSRDFDAEAENWMDVNGWLACLACSFYVADERTLGVRSEGNNAYLYIPARERRCKYIPRNKTRAFQDTDFGIIPRGRFRHIGRMCSRPWARRPLLANYLYLSARTPDFCGPGTLEFLGPWLDANYAIIDLWGGEPSDIKTFLSSRAETIRQGIPRLTFRIATNAGEDFVLTDGAFALEGEAPIDADLIVLRNPARPGGGEEVIYAWAGHREGRGRLEWISTYQWRLALTSPTGGSPESDLAWGANHLTFACYHRWQAPGLDAPFDGGEITITVPRVGFVRGDADADGLLTLGDPIRILAFLFRGKDVPCVDAADVDDDGLPTLGDAIRLLNYLFGGGPAPAEPFGSCGFDPTSDGRSCASFPTCDNGV